MSSLVNYIEESFNIKSTKLYQLGYTTFLEILVRITNATNGKILASVLFLGKY